jgi:serine/threonine protein kinase
MDERCSGDPPVDLAGLLAPKCYRIISEIGSGRTSHVYLIASTRWEDCRFVLKRVDIRANECLFAQELPILCSIAHPHVINIYDFFTEGTYSYLILEYCPGGSLMDVIRARGPLPAEQLYRCCAEVASGLAYCHAHGVSHGDIKPDNILLDSCERCKLADFGLGQRVEPSSASTQFAGSLAFMAPEVIARRAFDPFIADIWSLGVTFFWMARGCSPFPLRDTTALLKETQCGLPSTANKSGLIPAPFFHLLRQMIEPRPELRLSIQATLDQLAAMAEQEAAGRKAQLPKRARTLASGQSFMAVHWPPSSRGILAHGASTTNLHGFGGQGPRRRMRGAA